MTSNYLTREEWLTAAVDALRPLFADQSVELPPVRVSVGWPGGRGKKSATIGQCWSSKAAVDGVAQVFISPKLGDDLVKVLATLVHELVHAWDDCASGHRGAFAKVAKALGLEGKMTATNAGPDLAEKLTEIAEKLGDFPHGVLTGEGQTSGPKKQGTRMIKVSCPGDSEYTVRMTRKWLDEFGAPICPCCLHQMFEAE